MVDSTKKKVGSRVRELRKRNSMSAERLAEELGMHANSVYVLERGEGWISPEMLDALTKRFSVDPGYFFANNPAAKVPPTVEEALEVLREATRAPKPAPAAPTEFADVVEALKKAPELARQVRLFLGVEDPKDPPDLDHKPVKRIPEDPKP